MKLIENYWKHFIIHNPKYKEKDTPQSYSFCDNEKDANECAELVVKEIKQATSSSLWWYEKHNEKLPKIGDLSIVTDWNGNPKAIIEVINVEQVKYKNIKPEYAFIEGEGNKSLAYWKKVHWEYYSREMTKENEKPNDEMIIVCEKFKTIWAKNTVANN